MAAAAARVQPLRRSREVERMMNKYRQGTGKAAPANAIITHRSLAGGNYSVPVADYNDLITVLGAAARKPPGLGTHYLIENRTPIFPMIMDLDVAFSVEISDEQWLHFLGIIQASMVRCWGGSVLLDAYVAKAPPDTVASKQLTFNAKTKETRTVENFIKSGLHVYWPHVLVDMETAKRLRRVCVRDMEQATGVYYLNDPETGKQYPGWDSIIDLSVLESNGLRMLFAHKTEKCATCPGKKRPAATMDDGPRNCLVCENSGVVDVKRPYKPHWVLSADGQPIAALTERFRGDFFYAFEKTTVRAPDVSVMPVTPTLPPWVMQPEPLDDPAPRPGGGGAGAGGGGGRNGAGYSKVIGGQNYIFSTDENRDGKMAMRIAAIETFLNKFTNLGGMVPQTIRRLLRSDRGGNYYMAVGSNHYCNNVRRAHSHQDVYYILSAHHAWQCCWSQRKATSDVNMRTDCRGYSSFKVPVTPTLRQTLFDPHANAASIATNELYQQHNFMGRCYLNTRIDPRFTYFTLGRVSVSALDANDPARRFAALVEHTVASNLQILAFPPLPATPTRL
jgi:hypothetical protein